MNKTLFRALAALGLGLAAVSCDFLDRSPHGPESEKEFWKNEDQALRALNGVYDVTAWWATSEVYEWMIGDIATDDAEKGGENANDFREAEDIKTFKATPDNFVLMERWRDLYVGIGRANRVIEKVGAMDSTLFDPPAVKARIVAEATFLRGYFYFHLVNTWGPVPIVIKVPTSKAEYCTPRKPVTEVWNQIAADFAAAAAVLPEKADAEIGRATKGAANGMLAKSYIFMGEWTKARDVADMVRASGQYGLDSDYVSIFTEAKENKIESIFELQHVDDGTTDWGDDNEGTVAQIFQGPRGNSQPGAEVGWGFNIPSDNLVAALKADSNDVRFKATVLEVGDTLWPGQPDTLKDVPENPLGRNNRKYFWEYNDPGRPPSMSNDPKNWRVLRYADLLLLRAEAAAQLDDFATVKLLVDSVRTRAKAAPLAAVPADKAAALKVVYDERRLELALEGHRYYDILRTGRGVEILGSKGYNDNKRYLPVPQIELEKCEALKPNNPY